MKLFIQIMFCLCNATVVIYYLHFNQSQDAFRKFICSDQMENITKGFHRLSSMDWCNGVPTFFNYSRGQTVALASFPGSGNTWLRHLLQQMSGILTGCHKGDRNLVLNGFPAVKICEQYLDRVIAIKTHFPEQKCPMNVSTLTSFSAIREENP